MKRDFRIVLAIALICGVSVTGYTQIVVGAVGTVNGASKSTSGTSTGVMATSAKRASGTAGPAVNVAAKARAERLDRQRRAAVTDAYMMHMHGIAVGADSLLPSRPFPLNVENYVNIGTSNDIDANIRSGYAGAHTDGGTSTSMR